MKTESKEPLARLKTGWDAYYKGLGEAQRRRLWAGLGMVLALVGGIVAIAGRTQWGVLYSGLQARDAGAIAEKLRTDKVPYRLANGGATIEVPSGSVYQERLSLATQGLPEGQDKGYELLDGNNLLLSESAQRIDRIRALQGELERTILSMDGVEAVRVHLVVPDRQLFTQSAQSSSASVLLKLRDGFQMADGQVRALALLVSHAVEGLKASDVVVVDTQGDNLWPGAEVGGAGGGVRSDAQRTAEARIRGEVQGMLDEAIGPGQAVVRVHVDLDFQSQTITKDLYAASGPKGAELVQEESTGTSKEGSGGSSTNGVVSGNGLGPVASAAAAAPGSTSSNTSSRHVVYALDHTVEDITQEPGAVQRVAVAVLLKRAFSPAEIDTLRQAVQQTAGIDAARGDSLSVAVAPAALPAKPAPAAEVQAMKREAATQRRIMLAETLAPWALMLLAILLLSLLAWKALRMVLAPPAEAPAQVRGTAALPAPAVPAFPAPEGDVLQLVERNPSSAAQVLRRMMNN